MPEGVHVIHWFSLRGLIRANGVRGSAQEREKLREWAAEIMLPPAGEDKGACVDPKLKPIWQYGSEVPLDQGQYLAEALDRTRKSLRLERKVFLDLHETFVLQARFSAVALLHRADAMHCEQTPRGRGSTSVDPCDMISTPACLCVSEGSSL